MKKQISKTALEDFFPISFSFIFYRMLGIITDHNSVLAVSRDV